MLKEKEFRTDNATYRIKQLPARQGIKLGLFILKTLLGSVGENALSENKINVKDIMKTNVSDIISNLSKTIDEEKTTDIIFETIQSSVVYPKDAKEDSDEFFSDKYEDIFVVMKEIISLNFNKLIKNIGTVDSSEDKKKEKAE